MLLIVTLWRLLASSPLHIFLCIFCGDPAHGCVATKNVLLPLIYFSSLALYFVTVDVARILQFKAQDHFSKKAHLNMVAQNLSIFGSAGMFSGAAGCLIFLNSMG